jgi:pimeloyl-ACP methyl ester carboxylesterase
VGEWYQFDQAGHAAHWEQPEIWNRLVLEFIARH